MQKNSIKNKLYILIFAIILIISASTSIINYRASAKKIDTICKEKTSDNARHFASNLNGDSIQKLKDVIRSEEYLEIRQTAENTDDENLIKDYLVSQEVWDDLETTQNEIEKYLINVTGIKYIYIIDYTKNKDNDKYIYIVDDKSEKLYRNGTFELREKEFKGKDLSNLKEPIITKSEFGWICSDYKPIYNSAGECVAIVGCDIDMGDVMKDRYEYLKSLIIINLLISLGLFFVSIYVINNLIINPLKLITKEIQNFDPKDYESFEMRDLKLSNNEIGKIYDNIKLMQLNIVDYLKDKIRIENDIAIKDAQISRLNQQTYKDSLTGVNNKYAYNEKIKSLSGNFAIVMADINNLKQINDEFGHKSGDEYIKACCILVCNVFKHSPVYRIGGDEFVVILQDLDYNNRFELVKEIRDIFEETYNQPKTLLKDKYSASIGMADNRNGEPIELVFKIADDEMYKEKNKFKQIHGRYR